MTKIINFSESLRREDEDLIVVTFLGFMGHICCMNSIRDILSKNKIKTIEASVDNPDNFNFFFEFYSKIDGYSMYKNSVHLGLGKVKNQVSSIFKIIKDKIDKKIPIILCGHSQGGLLAFEFYKKYHDFFNIKGIICMSAPINGVTFLENLQNAKLLKNIFSKEKSFFKRNILPYTISKFYFPITKFFLKLFNTTINDFLKSKKNIKRNFEYFSLFKRNNLPVLNISAYCDIPDFYKSDHNIFGEKGILSLLNSHSKKNDNILAIEDQKILSNWKNLEQIEVFADHGVFKLPNAEKIFDNKKVLEAIVNFIKKV